MDIKKNLDCDDKYFIPSLSNEYKKINRFLSESKKLEEKFDKSIVLHANENKLSNFSKHFLHMNLGERYHLSNEKEDFCLTNKNGFIFKNFFEIREFELHAKQTAYKLLSANFIDFRLLSGVHATITTVLSLTEPGQLILSLNPLEGGHFATTSIIKRSERRSQYLKILDCKSEIDINWLKEQCSIEKPSLILIDDSCPIREFSYEKIKEVIPKTTILIYDASHSLFHK
ncbi:hypothetical protein [Fluviispira sanaruensis]|uniref:Serine hydroxymethyltransferase-like domain-containing protein n=1 Tax=Fluviispira sanaruensis TaxID=2493639 RepID=A0A4P2VP38_FLUSA|nr:hypothetical protein [Fluviispira sanaruensis]BBH53974.1 hypothetical protein JCM31447_24270 [Fluviispira sanaruensis]